MALLFRTNADRSNVHVTERKIALCLDFQNDLNAVFGALQWQLCSQFPFSTWDVVFILIAIFFNSEDEYDLLNSFHGVEALRKLKNRLIPKAIYHQHKFISNTFLQKLNEMSTNIRSDT